MRRPFAKTLREKVEAPLTARAFAEESEVETAREILSQATTVEPRGGSFGRCHLVDRPPDVKDRARRGAGLAGRAIERQRDRPQRRSEASPGRAEPRWMPLVHRIPPAPACLRVEIGRRLARIGALVVKRSVHALARDD